jgi:hypothetical protein
VTRERGRVERKGVEVEENFNHSGGAIGAAAASALSETPRQ